MIEAPLALGFTAGLFAVLNPCGFAMLPAYLSFFLVGDTDDATTASDLRAGVRRAIVVALSVSAGFAALFALIGFIVRTVTSSVMQFSPWVSIVIGVALALFGLAVASGRKSRLALPRLDRGGITSKPASMALYGVSYGIVSLSCTLPVFLVYVAGTLTTTSVASGVAVFGAYAAGFATLLTTLTIAVALARRSLVTDLRRILPYVERMSGVLLFLAGTYVAYYGWYARYRFGESDPVVDRATGLSFDLQRLVTSTGIDRIGWILVLGIGVLAAWALPTRRRRRTPRPAERPTGTEGPVRDI